MKTMDHLVNLLVVLIRSWCSSRRAERSTGYRQPGWWSELATSSRSTLPTRLARWDTHLLLLPLDQLLTAEDHPWLWPDASTFVLFCFFQVVSSHETQAQEDDPHTVRIDFEPSLYQCFENCGSLKLTVGRHGGDPGVTVKVCVAGVV